MALGLTSLGCMGTGMFTLIYAAPTVGYPYGIASGVWTGLFVSYSTVTITIHIFIIFFIIYDHRIREVFNL